MKVTQTLTEMLLVLIFGLYITSVLCDSGKILSFLSLNQSLDQVQYDVLPLTTTRLKFNIRVLINFLCLLLILREHS